MIEAKNLLIIEDHDDLREVLTEKFENIGYFVTSVSSYEEIRERCVEPMPEPCWDIALLDVNLPGLCGFEIAEILKKRMPQIAIIIMTVRTEVQDRIKSYESGAINYIAKPLKFEELIGIFSVVQQRLRNEKNNYLGGIYFSFESKQLYKIGQFIIKLTEPEALLLRGFIQADSCQLNYEQILDILSLPIETDKNLIEIKISRLRKKLNEAASIHDSIQTLRGKGYKLNLAIKLA
jgi:DNA-binding response OmpR family regulator